MKILHYINFAAVAITLLLYASMGFNGFYAQFILGCFQLLFALILTLAFKKFDSRQTVKLFYYWIGVIIWFVLALSLDSLRSTYFEPVIIIAIPMCIAAYFVYVTYRIHSDFKK